MRIAGIHHILAVARALSPAIENLSRAALAMGDVLGYGLPGKPSLFDPLSYVAAVATGMIEEAAARHVPGVAFGGFIQAAVPT